MRYKHLESVDWNGAKLRSKNGELMEIDNKAINEAEMKELDSYVKRQNDIMDCFKIGRRNEVDLKPLLSEFFDKVMDKADKCLKKVKLTDCWGHHPRWWEIRGKYAKEVLHAFTKENKKDYFCVNDLLAHLQIENYSIPYSKSRVIETNHFGEVLSYAVNKHFKCGYFIVKTKRKYVGMRISTVFEETEWTYCQVKITPIPIEEAKKGIMEFMNAKIDFDDKILEKNRDLIKQEIIKEKQRVIEKEI